MRKRFKIVTSILIGILANAQNSGNQSQYDPSIKSVPTSPEVALLGRFGDVPVGHYTGTAQISIPLYNLKVDDIEIPLALSYHTSGIKVADEATWVGLGWNFMPEGTITQEIRGREDFSYGGDGFPNTSGYNIFKSNFLTLYSENQTSRLQSGYAGYNDGLSYFGYDPANGDYTDIILRLKEQKGQPDIFTYNFYGYSGKFFYNPENANEILFMESNDDVKFTRNYNGWLAITNKGDKFYFYDIEKSKSDQTDYIDKGYTFKISEIILVSGKKIKFTYQDENTYQNYPAQVAHITNFSVCVNCSVIKSNNAMINEKKTLIGIETDDTFINFNLSNREDIRPGSSAVPAKKLNSIDIKSKYNNRKIKSFEFNQSYFPHIEANNLEEGYKNKRLKLNSIQEVHYDESGNLVRNQPPYYFEYDMSHTMPSKMASSDFYGYYNGNSSDMLLPDLSFFDYLNKPPYKNYNYTPSYPYNGSNRYPNSNYVSTNILNKIIYPTTGSTSFEYESNTFSNQFIPTQQQAQLVYRTSNTSHRGPGTEIVSYVKIGTPFKIGSANKLKFYNTIYDGYNGYYPTNHTDFMALQEKCYIELYKRKTVNGSVVSQKIKEWRITILRNEFEQTHQMIWNESLDIEYDANPTTEYYVVVVNGISAGNGQPIVSSDCSYLDYSLIDQSISYGNGLRVKSIKSYDSNNSILSEKKYEYNGGKLIYKFEPLNLIREATYKTQPTIQHSGCYLETIITFNDLSVNSSDFGINGNKPFGYSEVIEKEINIHDDSEKGYTKYYFDNREQIGTSYKGIPKVDIPTNGENTLIEIFDQAENKISSKFMSYGNLDNTYGIYNSFHIINTSTGLYDPTYQSYPIIGLGCGNTGGDIIIGISYTGHTATNAAATTKYVFFTSPLITGKRRLKTTIDTQYLSSGNLINKVDNLYNGLGNLWISKRTMPDGKIVETEYKYADWDGNTLMEDRGMTGLPITTQITSDGKIVSKNRVQYPERPDYPTAEAGYLVLPLSVKTQNLITGNLSTEVSYDKYNSTNGNLLQYTTKSGISTAIVWGYNNTQPIAKIEGAKYSDVSAYITNIISKSDTDNSLGTPTSEQDFLDALDLFRKKPELSGFQITTYSYDPLIGVRSITPANGVRQVYIYDTANRLKEVREHNETGNVLKEYQYHYKPSN